MTTATVRSAVQATGLRKSFGDKVVLDGIDLDVAEGTIFSLLGPNGAGKTTAVQILSTLLNPDAGEVRVAGFDPTRDPDSVRAAIGVTGQFSAVDNLLTGEENLMLMADLHHLDGRTGRRRASELLDRFDLLEVAGQMVATYSGGMRRRLDLAMTLIGDPRIIFLDEPTTGLDPRSRRTHQRGAGGGCRPCLRVPPDCHADRVARRHRYLRPHHPRPDLGGGGFRAAGQDPRGRQQPVAHPHSAAVCQ